MIRINLLPHKKKVRTVSVEGEKVVAIGFGILGLSAAFVFFAIHSPLTGDIDAQTSRNAQLVAENAKIQERIADFDALQAAFTAAQKQAVAIEQLNAARATPANFLFELATILRLGGQPTVTAEMAQRLDQNENLRWQSDWDPKHIWIDSLKEKEGVFTLMGKAQSDSDVTQLAHRLSASAYFDEVQPEGSSKSTKTEGGITIYDFKISGRVRY
jgi:Tfp pilus assembly protein PilN